MTGSTGPCDLHMTGKSRPSQMRGDEILMMIGELRAGGIAGCVGTSHLTCYRECCDLRHGTVERTSAMIRSNLILKATAPGPSLARANAGQAPPLARRSVIRQFDQEDIMTLRITIDISAVGPIRSLRSRQPERKFLSGRGRHDGAEDETPAPDFRLGYRGPIIERTSRRSRSATMFVAAGAIYGTDCPTHRRSGLEIYRRPAGPGKLSVRRSRPSQSELKICDTRKRTCRVLLPLRERCRAPLYEPNCNDGDRMEQQPL
jgi:hypothetical protein